MKSIVKELDLRQFHTPDIRETRIINADLEDHLTDTLISPAVDYISLFY